MIKIKKIKYNRDTKSFSYVEDRAYASSKLYKAAMDKAIKIHDPRAVKFIEAYYKAKEEEDRRFNPTTTRLLENSFYQEDKVIITKFKKLPDYDSKHNNPDLVLDNGPLVCHIRTSRMQDDFSKLYFFRKSEIGDKTKNVMASHHSQDENISKIDGDTRIIPFDIYNDEGDNAISGLYCDATDTIYGMDLIQDSKRTRDVKLSDIPEEFKSLLMQALQCINPKTKLK